MNEALVRRAFRVAGSGARSAFRRVLRRDPANGDSAR